jgi:hypothetical protein
MSKTSTIVAVTLGVVGVAVILAGAGQIIVTALSAAAPISAAPAPLPVGTGTAPAAVALTPAPLLIREILRSIMPAIISIVLLVPSSLVALSKDRPQEHQRWATATLSSIITYWLT